MISATRFAFTSSRLFRSVKRTDGKKHSSKANELLIHPITRRSDPESLFAQEFDRSLHKSSINIRTLSPGHPIRLSLFEREANTRRAKRNALRMRVPGDYACAKACVEGCEGHIISYLELRDNVVRLPWPMRYGSARGGGCLLVWDVDAGAKSIIHRPSCSSP